MVKKLVLAVALASLIACNKSSNSDATGGSTITLSGKISGMTSSSFVSNMLSVSGVSGMSIQPMATTDYKLYCIAFSSPPASTTSDFGTDGSFSVNLPANTNFGCFINSVATNLPVATLVNAGSGSGMSNTKTDSFSLGSSVDVGTLTLDLVKNEVAIPAAALEGAKSTVTAGISLTDIDNYEWTMTCVSSGVTEIDSACNQMIMDGSPTGSAPVYLRILSGTEAGATKYGISVWKNYAAFQACGGIELNTATKTDIESSGFTFATSGDYAPVTASTFTGWADTTNCPLRSANDSWYSSVTAGAAHAHENLRNNYCLAPMLQNGTGFSFSCEDSGTYTNPSNTAQTCTWMHKTAVSMSPGSSAAEMYGNFVNSESKSGTACGQEDDKTISFTIKFTRGTKY